MNLEEFAEKHGIAQEIHQQFSEAGSVMTRAKIRHECDNSSCPAEGLNVILTPSGVITMCDHHTRDNAEAFATKGYKIVRVTEGEISFAGPAE